MEFALSSNFAKTFETSQMENKQDERREERSRLNFRENPFGISYILYGSLSKTSVNKMKL